MMQVVTYPLEANKLYAGLQNKTGVYCDHPDGFETPILGNIDQSNLFPHYRLFFLLSLSFFGGLNVNSFHIHV